MAVLACVKPGVKPGQVVLAVDLTVAGSADEVLAAIASLGYTPSSPPAPISCYKNWADSAE